MRLCASYSLWPEAVKEALKNVEGRSGGRGRVEGKRESRKKVLHKILLGMAGKVSNSTLLATRGQSRFPSPAFGMMTSGHGTQQTRR